MIAAENLRFDLQPYETVTSYVSRLAQYCGASSPSDLCLDFGFRWQDVVRGDDFLLQRLADIAGLDFEQLSKWSVRTTEPKRFQVAGEEAVRSSFVRSRIRVCPQCILDDNKRYGLYAPYRRIHWQFWATRSCPLHHAPLISLRPEKYTIYNYDFLGQVKKHWGDIERAAASNCNLSPSLLERYLVDRLHKRCTAPFLDSLPLYIATRLCEVLGLVLIYGPEKPISDASEADLSTAGEAGFLALRGHESDLYAALDGLVSHISRRTVRHQSDFGAFFEWLRNASLGPEFEKLKDKVRDYIFRTYPFQEGDIVMGKACSNPAVFSINGACRQLNMERQRMNRYLLETGAATIDKDENQVWLDAKIGRTELDVLKAEIHGRLTVQEAATHLGVSVDLLLELQEARFIAPTLDALDHRPKFRRPELENFLDKLVPERSSVPATSEDISPIAEAAIRVRCPTVNILTLIMAGELPTVRLSAKVMRLGDIGVSVTHLKRALPPLRMPALSKGDASRRLRMTYQTINVLADDGLLEVRRMRNPKSRQFLDAVTLESVERFEARFITLGHLARVNRRASGPFKMHLENQGVCPEVGDGSVSCYYDRRTVAWRLRKLGLMVPAGDWRKVSDEKGMI